MQIIPLAAVASQTLKVVLAQQNCVLNVYQKSTGMYLDVSLEGEAILTGVLCRDRVRCVRQAYLGFIGDLAFMDTEGTDDPVYSGLGSRWVLMYLAPEDLVEKTTQASVDFQSRINAANAWAAAHPLVLTGALANGVQGVPYSSSITLQGQMASSAISWSVVGSLPAGLSLDSRSGVVSGTPTAGLTIVSFTLKAKDNLGRTATSAQTVKIGQTFTMATSLPGIMSLTRASIGTYFDPTAVLQVAANDQPRFDYDPVTLALRGLLIEEQRTNLVLQSGNPTNAAWTLTSATRTASGGTWSAMVGAKIASTGADWNRVLAPFAGGTSILLTGIISGTLFYKAGTSGRILLNLRNQTQALESRISGAIGAISVTQQYAGVTTLIDDRALTSGVRVMRFTFTPAGVATDLYQIGIGPSSGTTGQDVEVYGCDIQYGAFPTSYIPTTSSQVTRAADVATITVPSGFTMLTYGFDDGTAAQETVSAGSHTIPTPTAPKRIKTLSVTA